MFIWYLNGDLYKYKLYHISKSTIQCSILEMTSWANARVKLHSQVHFGSKKILSKNFCVQLNFGSNKFWVSTNFGSKRNVSLERNVGSKNNLVTKFFGSESNLESENNIGFRKMSGQKKFEPKKF